MSDMADGRDRGAVYQQVGRFGLLTFLIVFLVIFSVLRPESFATTDNFRAMLEQQTVVIIVAFAAMLPLIVGEFDLSVASTAGLANTFVVGLVARDGLSPGLAIAVTVLACTLIGLANGLIVIGLRVNSLVATLGTSTVIAGIALAYTGEQDLLGADSLIDIANQALFGLRLSVYYMLVVAAGLFVVLALLPVGRRMFAVGGNPRAAELSGIPTARYVIGSFVGGGFLAGLAGVLQGFQLGSASNSSLTALLLPGFAAAFLGATTIKPGRYNVIGTIIAAYFLGVMISGLQQLGAAAWVQPAFNGTALILAVAISGWALRRRASSAAREQLAALDRSAAHDDELPPVPVPPPVGRGTATEEVAET